MTRGIFKIWGSTSVLLSGILLSQLAFSADEPGEAVVVLRSTVTGNQEQPKVLYIVPWQQSKGPESLYRPLQSLVNDVFEPVERREFVRELAYRDKLLRNPEEQQR